jgi:hypothetical protein
MSVLEAHGGSIEKPSRNMKALGIDVTVHAKLSVEAAQDFEDESLTRCSSTATIT